jgi:hypothetical protein
VVHESQFNKFSHSDGLKSIPLLKKKRTWCAATPNKLTKLRMTVWSLFGQLSWIIGIATKPQSPGECTTSDYPSRPDVAYITRHCCIMQGIAIMCSFDAAGKCLPLAWLFPR